MNRFGIVGAVALCCAAAAGQARAELAGPAELPPAAFADTQYVDSRGCAFSRADIGDARRWLPRIRQDGTQVCGMKPSLSRPLLPAAAGIATRLAGARKASPASRPIHVAGAPAPGLPLLVSAEIDRDGVSGCRNGASSPQVMVLNDGRQVVNCGRETSNPVAWLNTLDLPRTPVVGYAIAPPRGYVGPGPDARGPRSVARTATSTGAGGRVVQAGVFALPANASRATAAIAALGLPVRSVALAGGRMAVLAGPFATPGDAARALPRIRASGYPDAYLR